MLTIFGLWAFLVYVRFFAPREQLLFIVRYQIDKLAHLTGGVFLALVWERLFGCVRLRPFLALIAIITVGWEIHEFFFDQPTIDFYARTPDLWRLDTMGDITAAFLGAYGYWVFGRDRT